LNKSIAYRIHSSRLYNTHTTSIMSAKSILEADGKAILNYHLTRAPVIKPTPLPAQATHNPPAKLATITFQDGDNIKGVLDAAEAQYPFLLQPNAKFVAKPDQLIKRRGKSGLLKLNATWQEARDWIEARANKVQKVEHVEGVLRNFLVEPFVPHPQETEYYININSVREVSMTPQTTYTSTQRLTDIQSRATGSSSTTKAA
jgi:ATP citrate (pro-S)-lyase